MEYHQMQRKYRMKDFELNRTQGTCPCVCVCVCVYVCVEEIVQLKWVEEHAPSVLTDEL